jgi:micrococcal nuclease
MIQKHLNAIPVLLLSCIFLLYGVKGASSSNAGKGSGKTVRVEKIYDGDTIGVVVDGRSEKIRLIGVDTPEMDQRPWGRTAKKCLESLLAGSNSRISLEYDIEQRDKYGRILGYIWIQDGRMLNEEMLKKGCAVLLTCPPNVKYVKDFAALKGEKVRPASGVKMDYRKGRMITGKNILDDDGLNLKTAVKPQRTGSITRAIRALFRLNIMMFSPCPLW